LSEKRESRAPRSRAPFFGRHAPQTLPRGP
jgi:hypothetical protein